MSSASRIVTTCLCFVVLLSSACTITPQGLACDEVAQCPAGFGCDPTGHCVVCPAGDASCNAVADAGIDAGPPDAGPPDAGPPDAGMDAGPPSCAVDNGGCDVHATCADSTGTIVCTCNAGFTGNGTTCATETLTIGGTLSGATGPVVLENGGESLSVDANGPFTFSMPVAYMGSYAVTVMTPPSSQTCAVSGGTGVATADVTSVSVSCLDVYPLGGTLAGLAAGDTVVLQNGSDMLTLNTDGPFQLPTPVTAGGSYTVSVVSATSNPTPEMCTVTGGSGADVMADVTSVEVVCVADYTVGGSVTALAPGASVTLGDASGTLDDMITITSNGTFTFPALLASGSSYSVTVTSQPAGQVCSVMNGQATSITAHVSVVVDCENVFTVSGTISGILAPLTITDNGNDDLTVTNSEQFTFAQPIPQGGSYAVTIPMQPDGQLCTITNGSGSDVTANVTGVTVSCVTIYTVGGMVTGLTGTLVLENSGGDPITLTQDGAYTFDQPVVAGAMYSVTVSAQPPGQICTVENASGTSAVIAAEVDVVCANAFSAGGLVQGLDGTLVLADGNGDSLTITGSGQSGNEPFSFVSAVSEGGAYSITVSTQPANQVCTVAFGGGFDVTTNVTDVMVSCLDLFTVAGKASGLVGTVTLGDGTEQLQVSMNGYFGFPTVLPAGTPYNIVVTNNPAGQECTVTNGMSGGIQTSEATVTVSCVNVYTVGGTVTGLDGTLFLQDSSNFDTLKLTANGPYTFTVPIVQGNPYSVAVKGQPEGQRCTIANASGTIQANVADVNITCVDTYTLGGTVTGLTGALTLSQSQNGPTVTVTSSGQFAFALPLDVGTPYAVTVADQPPGQQCTVTSGTGPGITADVTTVAVSCVNIYVVGVQVSGLNGTLVVTDQTDQLSITTNGGPYAFPTALTQGTTYSVSAASVPAGQSCTVSGEPSGGIMANATLTVTCINIYTISGQVNGLTGTLVVTDEAGDQLTLMSNAEFQFPTPIAQGSAWAVNVTQQPTGQSCSVVQPSSGSSLSEDILVTINCTNLYTVGGSISGLVGSVTLDDNGGNPLTLTGNGPFTFTQPVLAGDGYAVTVASQPSGQVCTVTGGSGNNIQANVTSVAVTCVSYFSLGGSVTGLVGTLVLDDGYMGDSVTMTANGSFSFPHTLPQGTMYDVTVAQQPANQICTVSPAGSQTIEANVTNVSVTCVTQYTVSGTISGLSGMLTLSDTVNGNVVNTLMLTNATLFSFPTTLGQGSSWSVAIGSMPANQVCTLANGSGTNISANITNVSVTCVTYYSVGGNVTGLEGTVVLEDNGSNPLTLTGNGSFTFGTTLAQGSAWNVTVSTQPAGQICSVAGGSGTNLSANITSVAVTCVNYYSIGGTLSGLVGTVVVEDNGGNALTLTNNGTFTFSTQLPQGSSYDVTVSSQPTGQSCIVGAGSGTDLAANVTSVTVTCVNVYTLGGTISGLTGSVVLEDNGGNAFTVTTNGQTSQTFTFPGTLTAGSPWDVTVATQPSGQTCTVSGQDASGTSISNNISNVAVTCVGYTLVGTVSGLVGTLVLDDNGGNSVTLTGNGGFEFAGSLAPGSSYDVTVASEPSGQGCTVMNGSGSDITADVTNIQVTCEGYTVGGTMSGLTGSVVLEDNGGNALTVTSNGSFIFPGTLAPGASYAVTVSTQPAGETCTVTSGSGANISANVTNVAVTCVGYTLSASVSGLSGTLVLKNTTDGNTLTATSNGSTAFSETVAPGGSYDVVVSTQPTGQECLVTSASGSNVQSNKVVTVTCYSEYSVGGTVGGISGTLILYNNGGNPLTLTSNGTFSFTGLLLQGQSWSVTIDMPPTGETCSVTNGSGTDITANVTNVSVSCGYTVGGTVSGLTGAVVLEDNGGNALSLSSNGSFTFPGFVQAATAYGVTVETQPTSQLCSVSAGSGSSISANVTNVDVLCATVLANEQDVPLGLAADSGNLYWTTNNASGAVLEMSKSGGTITTLASGQDLPFGITADSTSVYWNNAGSGTVMMVPIAGGTPTTLASGQSPGEAIAVDSTYVYWSNYATSGSVLKVAILNPGGTPTTLVSSVNDAAALLVTSEYLFVASHVTNTGTILEVPLAGGSVVTIASAQEEPSSFAIDSTYLYWTNTNSIERWPLAGGSVTALVTGQSGLAYMAVDSTSLYWTNSPSNTVSSAPLAGLTVGESPTVLEIDQGWTSYLVVDSSSLYWTTDSNPGQVMSVAK